MKTVLTYGTFDLFHIGHVNLLRRLRDLGDRLVVGCSTDAFNQSKGKQTVMPYAHREAILRSNRYVDDVFPEESWAQKRADIVRESASIFAMGDDWVGHFDELEELCEVVYLPRTRDVSTTDVKQWVNAIQAEKVNAVNAAVEHLQRLVRQL